MPKRTDIHKILVIGSGPIVIGQAAEFDYAGTQACLALKEEGYEVVLCNSNPATIMTDTSIADKVYMEPLTLEYIAKIVRKERPDAILPGIGGQTGLNLAMQLEKKGVLAECHTELLGTKGHSIKQAEDRELFKELCLRLGEPVLPSEIACSMSEGIQAARGIGYPVVLRPAFTLGGTGGGFADSEEEFIPIMKNALALSPVSQVLIEKSVKGYKEIEYEVMRDSNDTAITICNMENMDPVGIHTGDSIVVCPSQTLTNKEYHMLRDSALKVIRALEIEGGCNVQFALDPNSFRYYLIEVNPRVSRSSALASKASGYPIARVSAKIGIGMTLDEIPLANTPASFEPALDYVVTKMPRFPFDKFTEADNSLSTQMKATGEVMSIGRTLEASLLKAVRSLETGHFHLHDPKFDGMSSEELFGYIRTGTDDRIFAIAELYRRQPTSGVVCHELTSGVVCRESTSGVICRTFEEEIHHTSGIDPFFLRAIRRIIEEENALRAASGDLEELCEAKKMGFSDREIGVLWNISEESVFELRKKHGIMPVYKMIDTCASEFDSYVPYFYSTYETAQFDDEQMPPEVESAPNVQITPEVAAARQITPEVENEVVLSDKKKVLVLGAGPIRIGQGVEFDYSTVHAVQTIRKAGYEAIIINNNPETVSTDYTCSDKLYFEPLCVEDVMNVIEMEKPEGVIATLGGQTAINLADPLRARGVRIIGTDCDAIDRAENRDQFEKLLESLGIPQPKGLAVTSAAEGLKAAEEIGYPVLVRPSFVLGGRAMQIVAKEKDLRKYLQSAEPIDTDRPVLVDHYIRGREVEVDAVCDGELVFVPGIMELVERTGVHSGDSISVYPPYSLSQRVKETILNYTGRLGLGIGIRGLFNIQFIVDEKDDVYIIEVNPRSSRTVPFLSKATGRSLADMATLVSLGVSLREQGLAKTSLLHGGTVLYPAEKARYYVKVPAFSFSKLHGMDAYLSPEMKSTGEAIGYDRKLHRAVYKAMIASGMTLRNYGTILVSVADEDKIETIPLVRRFYEMGFNIEATTLTAEYLKEAGIRTRVLHKPSEHSEEMLDSIRAGYVSYVINTRAVLSGVHYGDGVALRSIAAQNNVVMLTSLDTVRMLLDVLEEVTMGISTIDAE